MWIDPVTKDVARTHSDIRNLRPNWSGPAVLTDDFIEDLGFVTVTLVDPQFDAVHQVANELAPELVVSGWVQRWEISDLSEVQVSENLVTAIQVKNAEINNARLAANFGTFTFKDKQIACDTLSRSDIDGANGYISLFGELPPDWVGGWKTVDNDYVRIASVSEWKLFYKAMYDQGSTNFKYAQMLKGQLAKATKASDISAINWEHHDPKI